ncbi:DUF4105 domain-containing protein [Arcobacter vandammei]|uniref:Lnb N-terminal periplasmic domain-containing protein n=1 Tax=Arcobacter vandammei TaxID=2782243 RepID=UPI0018DFEA7C|nr:DUF4105 domain-containing protein [Arcobacter vandammei]
MQNISNFIKLGFKFFIFKLLFFSSLFSSNIENFIEENKIFENSYWSKLLHYRNGESQIDSSNFFASQNGKNDLKKELLETIKSLKTGKNNILCRFPLRVSWLKEQIPELEKNINTYTCEDLDKYLEVTNAKYVTLVFPTSHINSPASMYGHTFLKISSDKNTPLISNAINYAAKTDEKNGLIYAYKGLFGEYEGRYSILPYYEKIKEYNNLEQRDVWEYDLNLNEDEIRKLTLHAWELKDSYADYFFFKENCSYAILWLLEVARPSLDLVNNFLFKTIPLDTIKLISKNSLIESSNYRYSNMKKMKYILDEKIENKEFVNEFLKEDKSLEESLSRSDKISYLDLKSTYLQYERAENKLEKDEYTKRYLNILKQRSKFKEPSNFDIKEPINPLNSHDSARISLFYTSNDSFLFGIKPAYNDIYDIENGYLEGAYIDFFDLNLKKEKNKDLKLDRFTLLKIKSLASQDLLFKPISWGIDASFERFDNELFFKIKPEVGLSYTLFNTIFYSNLATNILYKAKEQYISLGSTIGFVTNSLEKIKFGSSFSYDKYDKRFENRVFEAFSTYSLDRNIALNLNYKNDNLEKKQDILKFGIFYYF